MAEKIRLAKLLSNQGLCSRREAEDFIQKGLVKVNSQVWTNPAEKVNENDTIELLPQAQDQLDKKLTVLINKPLGYVSNLAEKDYKPAIRLITNKLRDPQFKTQKKLKKNLKLAPAGRLDIDSTGLLILTDDGRLAKKVIGKDSLVEKEYVVKVKGQLTEKKLNLLRAGLYLDGKEIKQAKVTPLKDNRFRIVLIEGRKRQIRRMCQLVDLQVVSLKRVRIGNIKIGTLAYGQWRFLEDNETV